MQDFARVEITDASDEFLIEQSGFDRTQCFLELPFPVSRRHDERIGTETPLKFVHRVGVQQADRAESSAIPVFNRIGQGGIIPCVLRFQRPANTPVLECGRIRDQHEARHSRFDDQEAG